MRQLNFQVNLSIGHRHYQEHPCKCILWALPSPSFCGRKIWTHKPEKKKKLCLDTMSPSSQTGGGQDREMPWHMSTCYREHNWSLVGFSLPLVAEQIAQLGFQREKRELKPKQTYNTSYGYLTFSSASFFLSF